MRLVWTATAAILAVACATSPVPSSNAKPVPPERIHAPEFTRAQPGFAFVVVTRDKGLKAITCDARIFVDGTRVADLRPGEQVRLFVEEGKHLVGVKAEGNVCIGGADQLTIEATRAKPVLLRVEAGTGEGIKIDHSAF